MTPKQARFVAEYKVDLNATQAAIRAGYSPKCAKEQGYRLLTKAHISDKIRHTTTAQLAATELTSTRLLEEYRRLAFSDVRSLFDEAGNLRPLHELTDEQAACLASVEVVKKNITAGDGHVDQIYKVRLWDKTKAMNDLAKYFGLLVEKTETRYSGGITFRHELVEADEAPALEAEVVER